MLYVALGPSTWYSTHRRCWAEDSGSRAGRSRTVKAGRVVPAVSTPPARCRARRAGVGASKTVRSDTSAPSAARTRAVRRIASREWPPSAKKSSSTPASGTPRTAANASHSRSSRGVRGLRPETDAPRSGAGSACVSSLPATVRGSAGTVTKALGTMCAGSAPAVWPRSSAGSGVRPAAGRTYATSRRTPGVSSRTTTAAVATSGWRASSASISPGSIRKPRSLTWPSARPRNSSEPSRRRRTRSPVRYIREPGAPNGSAVNRSAVRPGRLR